METSQEEAWRIAWRNYNEACTPEEIDRALAVIESLSIEH